MAFDVTDPDSWTPADAENVQQSLQWLACYESFAEFVKVFWDLADPTPLVYSWHLDVIAQEAQAISEEADRRRAKYDAIVRECGDDHELRDRRIVAEVESTPLRLVLLIPPRGSKSTLLSKLFVLWRWARRPDTFLAFSAMESKIPEFGIAIRDVLRSDRYQAFMAFLGHVGIGAKMVMGRKDSDATIALTLSNGARWGGHPIGGRFTGKNVDIAIIDDPHDVDEAMGALRSTESKAAAVAKVEGVYKSKINDRYNLRMVGISILIMQRVHLNDLAAFMIKEGARVVTIPAEYDPAVPLISDPYGLTQTDSKDPRTVPGQSYNPSRFPPDELARLRAIDPFGYATKFLMCPTLQEGSKIQRAWFKQTTETGRELVDACEEIAISVDSASSTNKRSDYTSMGVWGRIGARRVLLDRKFGKWGFLALVEEFKALVKKWPEAMFKFVENKASGIQLIEVAEKAGIFGIVPVNPTEAKRDRLLYATSVLEAGNVYLAAPEPGQPDWRPEYINNMAGIDAGGLHDDDGDMTSQVMERWSRGFASWLTDSLRSTIGRPTLSTAISDMVRRWETKRGVEVRINREHQRQTTDIAPGFAMGLVPGWCSGTMQSAGTAIIVDHRGVMVAMVVGVEGGLSNFATVVAEEASYWGVTLTRYAELPGMPSIQTVNALHRAGVNVSSMPPVPGKPYKWAGQAGGGYSGKPDAAAVLWSSFLDAAGRGMVQIRDRATLTLIETLIEEKGVPTLPNGGPVTAAPLALLLAVTAASTLRESMKPRMAQVGIDLERLAAGA